MLVDILATGYSAQSYLPKSRYSFYSKGKVVAKLINAKLKSKKLEEEWAKGLWRELFG
jgi:hypothetical protein